MTQRDQLEITAYHEAGHAVMAMATGIVVTEISCQASDTGRGHTALGIPSPITSALRVAAVLTYASGMAADYLHWKSQPEKDDQEVSEGHSGDRYEASIHLAALGQGDVFDDYLKLALSHLSREDVWPLVATVADLLKKVRMVNGQEVLQRITQLVPKITKEELELIASSKTLSMV